MEEVCMIIPSDKPREYNYILESNETGKLSDILSRRYGFSTRILRNIKRGGILEVNGAPARVISSAVAGDKVRIVLPREKLDADPVDSPFDIIYEDSEILAVNKSPGVVSHPTKRHQLDTLANYAAAYAALRGDSYKLRFVNRLDMDTSGVIIIAKTNLSTIIFSPECRDLMWKKRIRSGPKKPRTGFFRTAAPSICRSEDPIPCRSDAV